MIPLTGQAWRGQAVDSPPPSDECNSAAVADKLVAMGINLLALWHSLGSSWGSLAPTASAGMS